MVESISTEAVTRVQKKVPSSLDHPNEIEDWLKQQFGSWKDDSTRQEVITHFSDEISDRRTGRPEEGEETLEEQTVVSGQGASGTRTTMVKDADNKFFGKRGDIKTWEANGVLMGYNPNTGKQRKLGDLS